MPAPLSHFPTIRRSPTWIVLLIGTALLLLLLARGLNIGPLHTDVIIQRAWFHEVGVAGFPQRMFDSNQRHMLYGPLYALLYAAFGENDLAYNLVYQGSRILEGVFMAGLVFQLTRPRTLPECAGLALLVAGILARGRDHCLHWII